jgi:hypothetical protein
MAGRASKRDRKDSRKTYTDMNDVKRRAIIVVSIGDQHQRFYSQTRRSIEQYAGQTGSAVLNVTSVGALPTNLVSAVCAASNGSVREPLPYVAKCWAIYDALGSFERVALLDSTCIVQRRCADVFDLVAPGWVGGFDESTMTDFMSWKIDMRLAKTKRGIDLPFYFNTGLVVVSKCHRQLFSPSNMLDNLDLFHGPYADQLFINLMLAQSHTSVCKLSRAYNYIPIFNYGQVSQRKIAVLDSAHLDITCKEGHIIHVTGYFEQRESILAQIIQRLLEAGFV